MSVEPAQTTSERTRLREVAARSAQKGRERLAGAKVRGGALLQSSKERSAAGAKTVSGQVRRHPFSAGLIALGAVGGGALLMNPALRRMAIASAPAIWKFARQRRSRQG